jgi:hypothetical protein
MGRKVLLFRAQPLDHLESQTVREVLAWASVPQDSAA